MKRLSAVISVATALLLLGTESGTAEAVLTRVK